VERVYLHLGGPVANFSRHVIVAAAHFEKKVYVCVTVSPEGEREREVVKRRFRYSSEKLGRLDACNNNAHD
jgi:hypothetical protein